MKINTQLSDKILIIVGGKGECDIWPPFMKGGGGVLKPKSVFSMSAAKTTRRRTNTFARRTVALTQRIFAQYAIEQSSYSPL